MTEVMFARISIFTHGNTCANIKHAVHVFCEYFLVEEISRTRCDQKGIFISAKPEDFLVALYLAAH